LIILGLDISTSNIGFCVLKTQSGCDDVLVYAEGLPLTKVRGMYAKAEVFKERLTKISDIVFERTDLKIEAVVIEASLQAFRRNMSSAATISKLNRFNGIVSYISRSFLEVPVHMVNVISARKQVGLKLDKNLEKNTKEQVLEWTRNQETMISFPWPTKVLKSGPRKGTTRYEDFCFDIADAFVVARWGSKFLKIDELDANNV